MISKFNYSPQELFTPVVFREDFSAATITATQAWSLFFTAGQEENVFGQDREIGWFYNNVILGWGVAFALTAICFSAPLSPLF